MSKIDNYNLVSVWHLDRQEDNVCYKTYLYKPLRASMFESRSLDEVISRIQDFRHLRRKLPQSFTVLEYEHYVTGEARAVRRLKYTLKDRQLSFYYAITSC